MLKSLEKEHIAAKKYVSNFLFPLSVIKWKKPSWDSIPTSLSLSSHSASHRLTVSTKQTACLWMTAADTATTCLGYTTCMPTIIITAISATMVTVTGDVRPQAMSVLMWFLTLRIQNTPKIQICPPPKKNPTPRSWASFFRSHGLAHCRVGIPSPSAHVAQVCMFTYGTASIRKLAKLCTG